MTAPQPPANPDVPSHHGGWRPVEVSRHTLQRQADMVTENIDRAKVHLATMASAYQDREAERYQAMLVWLAILDQLREEWESLRTKL